MRIRIDNIECRLSQGRYEIVKWFANPHYGAEERYLADGYKRVTYPDGNWSMSTRNHTIHGSCFQNPESCYTVATLNYRKGEECCDMYTVGARLLELTKPERADFFAVYEYAEDRIREEELARQEESEY